MKCKITRKYHIDNLSINIQTYTKMIKTVKKMNVTSTKSNK